MSAPSDVEPVVLAFDGGSTKTDVVLVSRRGTVLGRARVGPSNHQLVGLDGTIDALTAAVTAVLADAQRAGNTVPRCPIGVYCLAGLDLPVDEEKLTPSIEAQGWTERVILRNDTFAVSRAGTTASWGIGVVCGTGMNCAAIGPDGRTVRFPALAELSGDFAPGGAWLGVRALGLALRAGDGRGPATLLRERVPAQLGTTDAEAALTGVYSGTLPYNRLFELARVLLDAAADGDAPAREAADFLADEIGAFVRAAVVRLDLQDEAVEVVLGGGIFDTADAAFHARVAAGIHASAPRATLVRLDAPPVLGAALIGLDAAGAPAEAKAALRQALRLSAGDSADAT
ncbi:MAG TPA: BadF/BadG/BcrA/BcrD ATPase family protein [Acidimicrobiales bacterium]|nr:BadF/BadG/BcrA/BcrD ATPase family protein [Acidimicrobiales bacterium]